MPQPTRKINAKEIIQDIRSGRTDLEIMSKHDLSPRDLERVFEKLLSIKAVTQDELDQRASGTGRNQGARGTATAAEEELLLKCPSCGKKYSQYLPKCPECGFPDEAFADKPTSAGVEKRGTGAGKAVLIAGAIAMVVIAAAVATYILVKRHNEAQLAKQESQEDILTLQEKGEVFARQNELSGIVAFSSLEDIKKEFAHPDFDADAPDIDGRTLLMIAADYGRYEVVRELLYHDANMYSVDHDCNTPVILAAEKGYADIVDLFVSNAYDIDFKNKNGRSVRSIAHERGSPQLKEVVLRGTKIPREEVDEKVAMLVKLWRQGMNWRCNKICSDRGVELKTSETRVKGMEGEGPVGRKVEGFIPLCVTKCKAKFEGPCFKQYSESRD
ncbi:MAG: ankyrin repeat domain-containing protein [Pseudomonadota bacterium]